MYRDQFCLDHLDAGYQWNIFTRIKRRLTFVKKARPVAVRPIGKSLEQMEVLRAQREWTPASPMRIELDDFLAALDAAEGDHRAMLLMLITAKYFGEVDRTKLSKIDLDTSHRVCSPILGPPNSPP